MNLINFPDLLKMLQNREAKATKSRKSGNLDYPITTTVTNGLSRMNVRLVTFASDVLLAVAALAREAGQDFNNIITFTDFHVYLPVTLLPYFRHKFHNISPCLPCGSVASSASRNRPKAQLVAGVAR